MRRAHSFAAVTDARRRKTAAGAVPSSPAANQPTPTYGISQPMNAISQFGRRRVASQDGPDPIDVHVGGRIRLLRTFKGKSLERLAQAIGLTYQQVQKYEKGACRISASMLAKVAHQLDMPISAFFDDLPELEINATSIDDTISQREMLAMMGVYRRLDPKSRKGLYNLAAAMAEGYDDADE